MSYKVDESYGLDANKTYERIGSSLAIEKLIPESSPRKEGHLRFVCISDTHSRTEELVPPEGDVLIHAGDFSRTGKREEVEEFVQWIKNLDFKWKIVIAGNHDIVFDDAEYKSLWRRFGHPEMLNQTIVKGLLINTPGITYLQDSGVTISGINIYGSPFTPEYYHWGFQLPRKHMGGVWNQIPESTDILVTHGPPLGYHDLTSRGKRAGCYDLLLAVQRIKPRYMIFGHIHEGYGMSTNGITTFINCAVCTKEYEPKQAPIVFDYPIPN